MHRCASATLFPSLSRIHGKLPRPHLSTAIASLQIVYDHRSWIRNVTESFAKNLWIKAKFPPARHRRTMLLIKNAVGRSVDFSLGYTW